MPNPKRFRKVLSISCLTASFVFVPLSFTAVTANALGQGKPGKEVDKVDKGGDKGGSKGKGGGQSPDRDSDRKNGPDKRP